MLLFSVALVLTACGGGGGDEMTAGATPTGASATQIASKAVTLPVSTYSPASAELGAWTVLQTARALCGFGALRQVARLDAAALAHARYLTSESVANASSGLSHLETNTGNPSYTGYEPWDRTQHQGYGTQVAEILEGTTWNYDVANPPVFPSMLERGAQSMLNLLTTVYHLQGAMYEGADVGMGADLQTLVQGTSKREEYRFGSLNGYQTQRIKLGQGQLATYPCQDSINVPPAFAPAYETPNPFPAITSAQQTVGPPIYLKADAGQVLTLTDSVVSSNGVAVATTWLTRANDPARIAPFQPYIGINEVFVVPSAALRANTSYQVKLVGYLDGIPFNQTFTMSTGQ
ncbi:MAG: hypothetical protein AUJ20_04305 [Comamonadaceae bacterium CG1_02_60_18]|nr:MAG: hypothetical protein AUJ20_04305 [Comamonadaceae bacterium CG1_02_60_18]PIQ53090.1 MAG: hypothetical protein COW02_08405 [Comamonadaceae bacterium CG12_big_fil_rev_8_21_14_0_65_59_15]